LDSDQALPGFRGVIFLAYLSSSSFLIMLSIQPKQSAYSTASA
jgi:hypothetical protein